MRSSRTWRRARDDRLDRAVRDVVLVPVRDVPRGRAHVGCPLLGRTARGARLGRPVARHRRHRGPLRRRPSSCCCAGASVHLRSRVTTRGSCSSGERAAARLARAGGDDLRRALRGVPVCCESRSPPSRSSSTGRCAGTPTSASPRAAAAIASSCTASPGGSRSPSPTGVRRLQAPEPRRSEEVREPTARPSRLAACPRP